ncbi:MAG: ATP-binding cassette domain-containing protein, partial [Candidatus Cloacimonadaceae bacterium]|nr:ATP-binding cassette domain-containing protein [Candidatus Cloacimonadota bacterium]
AERIFDLMELEPDDYRDDLVTGAKLDGEIEFENVWLAYNHDEWVLKDISFKIKPGEKIALVGHTGSGKTSIVNLILGMYPYQKGRILIDGKELKNYGLKDIRSNVGIVQQDVFIFSGNISENIALNNTDMSEDEIRQVAKYVNADKFISQLPHRYNEPVMERGATLSTGQRQLIAFARVLAYNPSIFILDEATSNIDTETELLIQDALEKIIKDRTSIIIAHRLSTIQHADRIIVLHKGKIVEEGSHFDLLDKKGLYYDLYRLQYT